MAAPIPARAFTLALILSALLVPTLASAQVPAPSVSVKLDENALSLGAANTTLVNATITYSDAVPTATGTITLALTPPDGWTATASPAQLTMTPGQSRVIQITLIAPADKLGAATGDLGVKATVTAGPGRAAGTGEAFLALTRVDPIPPPPPSLLPYYAAAAAAALLILGAVVLLSRRRARIAREASAVAAAKAAFLARETGIQIQAVDGPLPFGDKREAIYRVRVTNASDRPRIAVIGVADVPAGWRAAPSIPRIPLSPSESMVISLYVDPAPTAAWGQRVAIVVTARPEEAQELHERVTLDVVAPAVRVPVTDGNKSTMGAREDIRSSRFVLRR